MRFSSSKFPAVAAAALAGLGALAIALALPRSLSALADPEASPGAVWSAPSTATLLPDPPTAEAFATLVAQSRYPAELRYGHDPYHPPAGPREFFFTRAVYSGGRRGWRGGGSWSVDFPKADRQFIWGLRRLTNIDAYEGANEVLLTDPDLRRFPFLYALEVGYMRLSTPEIRGLRDYLMAGGFLFIDDFWGTYQWYNFEQEIRQVLPEHTVVELPLEHELFSTFYEITEIKQVPSIRYAWEGGPTWEQDGYVPHVRAIFDDDGRMLAVINWNTDLGDAWEWAEDPFYPIELSNFAYQLAVNAIIYAMSH